MPQQPLLIFPAPASASRSNLHGGAAVPRLPGHARQTARLAPRFDALRQGFASDDQAARLSADGTDPDRVVVLETVGSVENFARAVRRIEGMEWLGEFDDEELPADEDFADPNNPTTHLSGRVYLILTNQEAIEQLLSLWSRYQADPNVHFEQGLGRFKEVFDRLRDVRRWETKDRLAATGVLEYWKEMLEHEVDPIRFEAELWYLSDPARRERAFHSFAEAVQEVGGQCAAPVTIPPVAYHATLVRLPRTAVASILNRPELRLLHSEAVMFFRPTGQCVTPMPSEEETRPAPLMAEQGPPAGEPVVALLDGLPLENHTLLRDRLRVDDPLNWAVGYAPQDRQHGTGMASLILHGDLGNPGTPLQHPLYVRPVQRPDPHDWRQPRNEYIPEEVLICDLIHQAVRRIKIGDGAEPPAAPSVKIVNLSLGDPDQLFDRRMSAWARLLDWLSWEFNILFTVSAGNCTDSLLLDVDHATPPGMSDTDLQEAVLRAVYRNSHLKRLMSPSESVNALTVGACHEDASGAAANRPYRYDPVPFGHPSVYSRFGLGYGGAVKPDVLTPGGKAFVRERPLPAQGKSELEHSIGNSAPGHRVACPGVSAMELNRTHHTRGTSNAAALTTRAAAVFHDQLVALRAEPGGEALRDEFLASLLKALMVHGAGWTTSCEPFRRLFHHQTGSKYTPQARAVHERNAVARFFGYGVIDPSRVQFSDDHRVTLIGCGRLGDGQAHQFQLPLPAGLSGQAVMKRLVVTLAWLTPINPVHAKYRRAALWFEAAPDALRLARRDAEWRTVRRGTVQHEIFEGTKSVVVAEGDELSIKVNCRAEAGGLEGTAPYGLAVTLEVAPGLGLNIYDEIRTRLRPPIGIQP